ncbi:MAG: RAMP superfamily CRISPR-associated protein [candidate division KSB1 bacterium]|nr:RAMP superfamily CRISPR-associated protein [candidate division KSB1 bacterium]
MNRASEKPYDFVPFSTRPPHREGPGPGHAICEPGKLTGVLQYRLRTRSAVQVASGLPELLNQGGRREVLWQDTRIRKAGKTHHIVPGSSLKGAVRGIAEAISNSCVSTFGKKTRGRIPAHVSRCSQVNDLCPACRLFGMTGGKRSSLQGRVAFDDAVLDSQGGKLVIVSTPILWEPARRGLTAIYLQRGQAKGRKFYFHAQRAKGDDRRVAIAAGSVLSGGLRFWNLDPAELGLVLAALGLARRYRFPIKVGGGKPIGMGSVEVEPVELHLFGSVASAGRLGAQVEVVQGEELLRRIDLLTEQAIRSRLVDQGALEKVAEILDGRGLSERQAPDGAY